MKSINPATDETVWEGAETSREEVSGAVQKAKKAFKEWSASDMEERAAILLRYKEALSQKKEALAEMISREMGKPFWESSGEVAAMIGKVDISLKAYKERCPTKEMMSGQTLTATRHRPIGVLAVFGPFNFPGHLPNGHIVPALLAGNSIVFKPSELTPGTGEMIAALWKEAGLPDGVLNLVQGGKSCGEALIRNEGIDGVLFTGSWSTGRQIHKELAARPDKILALEMGGNAPLVIWDAKKIEAAVYLALQSAFITSGQRCSCARRLILPRNAFGKAVAEELKKAAEKLKVGPFTDRPEPFMGPLVSKKAAENVIEAQKRLISLNGSPLLEMERNGAFLTPGIIDMTAADTSPDEEVFGPLLQVIFVSSFDEALEEANRTDYGLTAALVSEEPEKYLRFYRSVRAGIVNWNVQTTGASSAAPFGGVGKSGNYRPSAFYAADYCAYPVASQERGFLALPDTLSPGVDLG